jgi:Protein of unknown function (DUF3179)
MIRAFLFILGMLILIGSEIARVYYIMPFPGSQESDTIQLAYFIHQTIWAYRVVGLILISYPAYTFLKSPIVWIKWPVIVVLGFWLMVVYLFNFRFLADKMFVQPETKRIVQMNQNKVPAKQLVIGVSLNGESTAYPVEIIGYHHQVRDTVGGQSVMVTYCTVCRTGRVYAPAVKGQPEEFRLVGMDHYNAMFEDSRTGSWWRQVNGEAITGPLKGEILKEITSDQMTLEAWSFAHPETRVLQPDSLFLEAYNGLELYDEGKMKGRLEGRDSVSWGEKSWVVGLQVGMEPRAYDWIELNAIRIVNDVVAGSPLVVLIEPDSATFHTFSRVVENDTLSFSLDPSARNLIDSKTSSVWGWDGKCTEGLLQGKRLQPIQSYQEYWHSWRTFRPQTTRYELKK